MFLVLYPNTWPTAVLLEYSDPCSCGNSWLILVLVFVAHQLLLRSWFKVLHPRITLYYQPCGRALNMLRCFFCCFQFSQQRRSSAFSQVQPSVYVYNTWVHVSSINCVFSYCFLIALGHPQNRKWLSINWRSTSFELNFFQDVYRLLLLPSPPLLSASFLHVITRLCYCVRSTRSSLAWILHFLRVCVYVLFACSR